MKYTVFIFVSIILLLCSCRHKADVAPSSDVQTEDTLRTITADMAYEGISNYCHKEYDWSVAKDNPDMMYVQMGEETVFLKPMSYYSMIRIKCDEDKCISCGKCLKVCPMEVEVNKNVRSRKNATECILCQKCTKTCPTKALSV